MIFFVVRQAHHERLTRQAHQERFKVLVFSLLKHEARNETLQTHKPLRPELVEGSLSTEAC